MTNAWVLQLMVLHLLVQNFLYFKNHRFIRLLDLWVAVPHTAYESRKPHNPVVVVVHHWDVQSWIPNSMNCWDDAMNFILVFDEQRMTQNGRKWKAKCSGRKTAKYQRPHRDHHRIGPNGTLSNWKVVSATFEKWRLGFVFYGLMIVCRSGVVAGVDLGKSGTVQTR